jgi:hypothetical protein
VIERSADALLFYAGRIDQLAGDVEHQFHSVVSSLDKVPSDRGGPMDEGRPISYEALPIGAAVLSSTDTQFGTVEHVLQIPELDLFDGIAVKTKHGLRFVDRDQVTEMTTTLVRCAITDEEAANLPAPKGALVLHPDTAHDEGPSLTARFGRLFGREHWKELE